MKKSLIIGTLAVLVLSVSLADTCLPVHRFYLHHKEHRHVIHRVHHQYRWHAKIIGKNCTPDQPVFFAPLLDPLPVDADDQPILDLIEDTPPKRSIPATTPPVIEVVWWFPIWGWYPFTPPPDAPKKSKKPPEPRGPWLPPARTHSAPEIDPGTLPAALTLLVGVLVIL